MSNIFDHLPVVIFVAIKTSETAEPVELRFTAGLHVDEMFEPSPEGATVRSAPSLTCEERRRDYLRASTWAPGAASPAVLAAVMMALARNDRSSYQVIEPNGDQRRYLSLDLGVLTFPAKPEK